MKRKKLHRRYGHTAKPGWASGRRPSHSEIWADGKPIKIVKAGSKWTIYVLGGPVVRIAGEVGADQGMLSFPGRGGFDPSAPVEKFTKDQARHLAHKIGHYMLGLGDFVKTYIEGY